MDSASAPSILLKLPSFLYFVVMALAVIGWLALIVFPRRPWANFWLSGVILPLLLCGIYIYCLLTFWFVPIPAKFTEFVTLSGVYRMFANQGLLLVGWINIIAMDLVVGAWMTRKAAQVHIPHVYLVPCLIVTFVFAGFGFPLFCLVAALGGRWRAIARVEAEPSQDSLEVYAVPRFASKV